MRCPDIVDLPPAAPGRFGWPWTDDDNSRKAEGRDLRSGRGALPKIVRDASPRVSITMPCFNGVRYIEEALRSVLLQGYPDLELMVFDGGSTDGTVEVLKRYEPWLAHWESIKDRGQSHAINKGLVRATGELFNWFNSDDIMCPGALKLLVALYANDVAVAGVCGAFIQFDELGNETLICPAGGSKEQMGFWPDPYFLPQVSSLYSTALCRQVGGVGEKYYYAMDMELVLKLMDLGRIAVTPEVIMRFRSHAGSKTLHGYYGGLVEFIAANFNLGQPHVAEEVLRRRMDGHAKLVVGEMTAGEVARMVDSWSYPAVARYLARRLLKNITLRMPWRR